MPVPASMTLAKWRAASIEQVPVKPGGDCDIPGRFRTTSLGGAPARVYGQSCITDVTVLVAVHERRGFFVLLQSPPANTVASDYRVFEQMRRSVRFLE